MLRSDLLVLPEWVPHVLNIAKIFQRYPKIDSFTYQAWVYHDYCTPVPGLFLLSVRYAGFIGPVTCLIFFLTIDKLVNHWCWNLVAVSMDSSPPNCLFVASTFAARIRIFLPSSHLLLTKWLNVPQFHQDGFGQMTIWLVLWFAVASGNQLRGLPFGKPYWLRWFSQLQVIFSYFPTTVGRRRGTFQRATFDDHTGQSPRMTGWWLGHPSEKYESQLGWLATQYMGK